MLSSVVSTGILLALLGPNQQLTTDEQRVWGQIKPRVAYLNVAGRQSGVASLIDERGYFIVHRSVAPLPGSFALAQLGTGQSIQLNFVSEDELTQLALLQSVGFSGGFRRDEKGKFDTPLSGRSQKDSNQLLAVMPNGPLRAELSFSNRMGVMKPSNRGVTLNEYRFETPSYSLAGALLFNMDGGLVGVLGATLEPTDNQGTGAGGSVPRGGAGSALSAPTAGRSNSFGPGAMTVAYAITPDILSRVIEGFLSPSHKVAHPAIGVFCINAKGGGVVVDSVTKGSNAEKAGIQQGDIIKEMSGSPIQTTSDFFKVIIRQTVGSTIRVTLVRGTEERKIDVVVGATS
ncbi:MAG: PDZ domain-containing protein [Fimbriimonadaceae bacterium]